MEEEVPDQQENPENEEPHSPKSEPEKPEDPEEEKLPPIDPIEDKGKLREIIKNSLSQISKTADNSGFILFLKKFKIINRICFC